MKKEAKVEFGITITRPWSAEMYAHNDQVADDVKRLVAENWRREFALVDSESTNFASDTDWSCASPELEAIQRAVTCYGYGMGFSLSEVAQQVEYDLDTAAYWRLKEIAEELDLVLEKQFIGLA